MANPFDTAVLALTPNAFWELEDAVSTTSPVDSSGNGHTGTAASVVFGTAGIVPSDSATCATLTTSSQITSSYRPTGASISLGGIVKFSTVPTSNAQILNGGAGTGGVSLRVNSAGKATIACNNVGTSVGTAMVSNHVYFVVGTWDGTTETAYQYDLTAGTHVSNGTAQAGSINFGSCVMGGSTLTGLMGRVFLIIGTTLSSSQITALAATAVLANTGGFFSLL